MFRFIKYDTTYRERWNDFVARSKNGTFLFDRGYMDYHSERFVDSSILVYKGERLYALMPASLDSDGHFVSHGGLTYGGLVMDGKVTVDDVLNLFAELNVYIKDAFGANTVTYKAVPYIYHSMPAEEDLYALTEVCNAGIYRRDISSAICLGHGPAWRESRKSGLRKSLRSGISVKFTDDYESFWRILSDNLMARYGLSPVHSLDEINLLAGRFPENIRLCCAYSHGGVMLGGTLLYLSKEVIHTQYISASPDGKENGAIDLIFDYILNESPCAAMRDTRRYLDFGRSNDADGLNRRLVFQKEGFGARAVCYDTYVWTL